MFLEAFFLSLGGLSLWHFFLHCCIYLTTRLTAQILFFQTPLIFLSGKGNKQQKAKTAQTERGWRRKEIFIQPFGLAPEKPVRFISVHHSACLVPSLILDHCVVWPGKRRRSPGGTKEGVVDLRVFSQPGCPFPPGMKDFSDEARKGNFELQSRECTSEYFI